MILSAMAGQDRHDSTSLPDAVPDYTKNLGRDLKGIKLGVPKEYRVEGIYPKVSAEVNAAIKQLESMGAENVHLSLPETQCGVAVYYFIATAQSYAHLAAFH